MPKTEKNDGRSLLKKKRPSKRAAGLRRNKVENEALFRRFIGVSGSLRRRFRWPELFSWVGVGNRKFDG